jgi:hypothetical protein
LSINIFDGFARSLKALVDEESLKMKRVDIIEKVPPGIPWQRQFSYAGEIGFSNRIK